MAVNLLAACLFLLGLSAQAQERLRLPSSSTGGPIILPAVASAPVPPVRVVRPEGQIPRGSDKDDFIINTELPGPERMFERHSEVQFFDRLKEEAKTRPGSPKVFFPEEAPISRERYTMRNWTRSFSFVEPSYLCHGRLYFEQKNTERYGWNFGPISPLVEAAGFYYDLALLPYHAGTDPCHCWDSSAGKCLPGDRVPLLLYPERFSITGLAAQSAVVSGLFFAFP